VIESFRNDMWPGYKTGEGIEPDLLQQFPLLEAALAELGVAVWPMVELEADDALAAAATKPPRSARRARRHLHAGQDLPQSVRGTRIVQLNHETGSSAMKRASSKNRRATDVDSRLPRAGR